MIEIRYTVDELWHRIERSVEKVKQRLVRAAATLDEAGIDYAVIGGNAVALWVAQVDESAVRNTRDVDILLRREDLPAATTALEAAGFVFREVNGVPLFLDNPTAGPRDAIHIVFAGEEVRPGQLYPAPEVSQSTMLDNLSAISLEALVRMKLVAFRSQDQVHLRDMLAVGLIDADWLPRLPADLRPRLQNLIDTPDG